MYLGTHACVPMVIASTIDIISTGNHKGRFLNNKQYFLLALGGILPDILWPHFSIHQRLTSLTHTIWFLAVLFPMVLLLSKWLIKKDVLKFTIIFWSAALLHIFTDGISGGISLFYPYGKVIGNYYISHRTWIKWDLIFICVTIFLMFVRIITQKIAYRTKKPDFHQNTGEI